MTTSTMKALRAIVKDGSKPSLELDNVPKPVHGAHTVVVKVRAAALNPSDVMNAAGNFGHTTFPRTPGRDYSGVVVDGPPELLNKEVYGTSGGALGFSADGTHAEYVVVPVDAISPKPSTLSFAEAATVGVPFTTAALALRRANIQPHEVILVLGASGAVGSAVCQIALSKGCRVLTGGRSDSSDVNTSADPELKAAKTLTGGKGPDVVIDTTGQPALLGAALHALAPRGRLSYITAPKSGSTEFTFDLKEIYRAEKSIVGCNSVLSTLGETKKDLDSMADAFEAGKLRTTSEDRLTKISIDQAVETYGALSSSHGKKFVIVFD